MVREKGDTIEDGADDPMLEGEEKQLAKKEEVKFTSASDRKNGDAKIDIGDVDKVIRVSCIFHFKNCKFKSICYYYKKITTSNCKGNKWTHKELPLLHSFLDQ